MKIYTVRDDKAEAYLPPFFARTDGEAMRLFTASLDEPNTNFSRYPADFVLFSLGEYSESTGVITPLDAPRALGNGLDFKTAQNQQ